MPAGEEGKGGNYAGEAGSNTGIASMRRPRRADVPGLDRRASGGSRPQFALVASVN